MQGIRAEQCISRSANDLDGLRLFGVDFEQRIDVAKSRGSNRDTVFEKKKRTTRPGACQNRRANCGEVFLAAAATQPDSRSVRDVPARAAGW